MQAISKHREPSGSEPSTSGDRLWNSAFRGHVFTIQGPVHLVDAATAEALERELWAAVEDRWFKRRDPDNPAGAELAKLVRLR